MKTFLKEIKASESVNGGQWEVTNANGKRWAVVNEAGQQIAPEYSFVNKMEAEDFAGYKGEFSGDLEEKPVVTITDAGSKGKKIEVTYKGQTITRTTKKEYTHVIIAISYRFGVNGKLIDLGFCGRYQLAFDKWNNYKLHNRPAVGEYENFDKPFFEGLEGKQIWEEMQIVKIGE